MKAEELRIGNLVTLPYEHDKLHVVRGIDIQCLQEGMDSNAMMPIPLSKEWLDRFGFEKRENSAWWRKGNFTYWQEQNMWYWRMEAIHPDLTKYVHQIQNLYHALTGEEL